MRWAEPPLDPPAPCQHRTEARYEDCYRCGASWEQIQEERDDCY